MTRIEASKRKGTFPLVRGESITADVAGWTVVTVDGFPLGWGKGVQGMLKNHYPRGWMA